MPAVTICPESKTDVDKFNLTRTLDMIEANETLNRSDTIALHTLSQVCDIERFSSVSDTIRIKLEDTNISNVYIADKLREIANNFYDLSSIAFINNRIVGFHKLTRRIITGEGVCYSFNMLDRRDLYKKEMVESLLYPKLHKSLRSNWTVFGYNVKDLDTYPQRIIGSGQKAGVTFILKMRRKDIDYACKDTAEGFRVTLHTPDELPMSTSHFYKIPFDAETLIRLQPRVMSTSDNLKHYKPKKRQCYFQGEKSLKYFKSYTQSNCKLECLTGELVKLKEKIKSNKFVFIRIYLKSLWLCKVLHASHYRNTDLRSK